MAWLAATRLLGWSGSFAVNNAAAQVQHACSSTHSSGTTSSSSSSGTAGAAAGLLLRPVLCVLQHLQYSDAQQAFLPAGVTGSVTRSKPAGGAAAEHGGAGQVEADAASLTAQLQEAQQVLLESFMQACASATSGSSSSPSGAAALQLAALSALPQLLQLLSAGASAAGLAAALQAACQAVLQLCCCNEGDAAVGTAAGQPATQVMEVLSMQGCAHNLAPEAPHSGVNAKATAAAAPYPLPDLQRLLPLLEPALQPSAAPQLQAAALQLLGSYLAATPPAGSLVGTARLLLEALNLLTVSDSAAQGAALELVQQYLQPAVLESVFGVHMTAEEATAAATQAAADGQDVAVAAATQPQRRLLQHLEGLLQFCNSNGDAAAAAAAGPSGSSAEAVMAAKIGVMRAIAGLYGGLMGSGCEEQPLLVLLRQSSDHNSQVCHAIPS